MIIKLDEHLLKSLGKASFDETKSRLENVFGNTPFEELKELYNQDKDAIKQYEIGKEAELERLTVEMIKKQFGVNDEIVFDVKLETITIDDVANKVKKLRLDVPIQDDLDEDVNLEISKRRIINSLIAGSARRNQFLFHFSDFPKEQRDAYNRVMTYNDYSYWTFDSKKEIKGKRKIFGCCWVKLSPRATVFARGSIFPVLLHETAKGVMELMSLWGLPSDKETREKVLEKADYLKAERWDLTHGGKIWQLFNEAFDNKYTDLRQYVYKELVKLPPKEFHQFISDLVAGNPKASQWLNSTAKTINTKIINHELAENNNNSNSIFDIL